MTINDNTYRPARIRRLTSLLVGVLGCLVYGLTTEPSVSWWDCGEFLATSRYLQIGHPPGAPFFSLLEHLFMMLAGGNLQTMAFFGNLLSAVAGGVTGGFLCATIMMLAGRIYRKTSLAADSKDASNAEPAATDTALTATSTIRKSTTRQQSLSVVLAGVVGSLCYVFCDTAWFSAVESEVYSLSMLLSAIILWAGIRWAEADESDKPDTVRKAPRWILLIALVLGLSMAVHQLTLLTMPVLLVLYLTHRLGKKQRNKLTDNICSKLKILLLAVMFLLIGMTPMLIIPIRASADTPLNEGDPSTWASYHDYVKREQYSHAPLYPRIWRIRNENDISYYDTWCDDATHPGIKENVQVFLAYQLNYMYLRYLLWNFSGRYNDRQGFGSLQNGQFITGIPPIDKMLVGTNAPLPDTMSTAGHNVYFLLPFLLAIIGICYHSSRHKSDFWTTMTLFIISGVGLSVYLNHPAFEPRERDYVYVLSFYAFAIWIGLGAMSFLQWLQKIRDNKSNKGKAVKNTKAKAMFPYLALLTLGIPLLMACQNWDDHNRASRLLPHDIAYNYLNECQPNAIFLTYGDNDTFPFWYLQYVEHVRCDVQIVNLNLLSADWYQRQITRQLKFATEDMPPANNFVDALNILMHQNQIVERGIDSTTGQTVNVSKIRRPVQISHYAEQQFPVLFRGNTQMVGFSYRVLPWRTDSVNCDAFLQNVCDSKWQSKMESAYIDEVTQHFLKTYWNHSLVLVQNLLSKKRPQDALRVLNKLYDDLNYCYSDDLRIPYQAQQCYALLAQDNTLSPTLRQQAQQRSNALNATVRVTAKSWQEYYSTISPHLQQYIPYTLLPLQEVLNKINSPDSLTQSPPTP